MTVGKQAGPGRILAKPGRRAVVIAATAAIVGLAAGAASILLDLGWALWIFALVALGLAIVVALSGTRPLTIVGCIVAVAIVAGGISWARSTPPLPQGSIAIPTFTDSGDADDVREMDRDDNLRIVVDEREQAVVAYSVEGEMLWASEESYAVSRQARLTGSSVVTWGGDRAILLTAGTGEVEWSVDVGNAQAFTANDEVIVFAENDRTFALDRSTGEQRWELAAEAIASSEGALSYDWHRWTADADWAVVGDRALGEFQVIDARTGESALSFEPDNAHLVGRWVIAGDTLVTFDYKVSEPIATGTPLTGGDVWTKEIHQLDVDGYYESVGEDVRIVHDHHVQWLDASTGELTRVEVPAEWSIGTGGLRLDGARTLVAKHRDGDTRRVGLFDSTTGTDRKSVV